MSYLHEWRKEAMKRPGQKLADRINEYWKLRGRKANARIVEVYTSIGFHDVIVSDIDPRWQPDLPKPAPEKLEVFLTKHAPKYARQG